jgi:hypothetical protein
MKLNKTDQEQLEQIYESIFDGVVGAVNSIKRGTIPWVGEEGNTETYLEYWKTFTSQTLKLIDNYDRNVSGIVGELAAEKDSSAEKVYRKIMFLKEFLGKQSISPWKYDPFNCSEVKEKPTLQKNKISNQDKKRVPQKKIKQPNSSKLQK